jgi:hypothetical protein
MRGRARGVLGLVAGVAIAALLAGASSAQAITYETGRLALVFPDEITTVKVKCPRGQHVLSGGQYIFSGLHEARLTRSQPYDSGDKGKKPDDGWLVSVAGYSPGGGDVTPTAICDRKQPVYRSVKLKGVGPPFEGARSKTAELECPRGTFAIGGGAGISGGWNSGGVLSFSAPFPVRDERADEGWHAEVLDFVGGPSSFPANEARLFAICGERRPVYVRAETLAPAQSYGEVYAFCPSGTALLGGGAWVVLPTDNFLTISNPEDSKDQDSKPDDAWLAEADNESTTFATSLISYAICRP